MNCSANRVILLILVVTAFASCGGGTGERESALRIQVDPLPGVYIHYDSRTSTFRIGNELVERRISIVAAKPQGESAPAFPQYSAGAENAEKHLAFTAAFINKLSGRNYVRSSSEEFSFRANGIRLSGVTGDFEYVDHQVFGSGGVKGLGIDLRAKREEIGLLEVRLVYQIYPHMPVIRKWIEIDNPGGSSVTVDSIQVESLSLLPGSEYDLEIYTGSQPSMGKVESLSTIVFDTLMSEGYLIGNEAPGVLKYSDLYSEGSFVSIGMRPYSQAYATEIQLAPGENFVSPAVFILFFRGEPDRTTELLAEFVAEYLVWSRTQQHSVWYENIPADVIDPELREKIQLAAESGADVFCLDGRWMDKRGDWTISENAHLESLGEYAYSLGMKFGLCVELAVADPDSQIVAEYPQWVVRSEDGSHRTIGGEDGAKMMCLGSEYTLYVANQIDGLVRDLSLNYIKLTGPMIPDGEASGCFAEDHIHRSSAESLWYIYQGLFAICEHLHNQHPDLIVDVSPESYDPEGLSIDYALLKYTDVEWPF